ncbi:MAG: zinc-dependent alcohol dehydrogenase family protein [Methylohalobius crimeensis]
MAHKMRAMLLERPGDPLRLIEREIPRPGPGQILIKVKACGVCRTDLHVVDGDLPDPKLPLIPGHEIVGEVDSMGEGVDWFREGQRVGIPWLGHTCGRCRFCRMERENLCDAPGFTGYTLNGGYAEYTLADARYCFPLPGNYDDLHAAPLLCAGLIGYRSYALAKDAEAVGLYGFGAAAHIIAQVAVQQKRRVYAFTRPGDVAAQDFARDLGAVWAGDSGQLPPEALDAAILYAPVGALVPQALKAVRKGGQVICAGIHMSDIPSFPYSLLWGERSICSVANLTRRDGEEFLAIAAVSQIRTEVHPYPLTEANRALEDLRQGRFQGAAVLVP